MKRILNTLLLMILAVPAFCFSNFESEKDSDQVYDMLIFKPINYSKIPLGLYHDGILGFSFGMAYERQIEAHPKWTWTLPLTYTHITNKVYTDYYPKGSQLYISPGVNYYPKGAINKTGYHVGMNVIAGFYNYKYSSDMSSGNERAIFGGLLVNNHYSFKFGKRSGINVEAGLGLVFSKVTEIMTRIDGYPLFDLEKNDKYKTSFVGNFSIGWIYAFNRW